MQEKFLEKLINILNDPYKDEYRVMYIMVGFRKVLDELKKDYPCLRFYCNWVVHNKIDRLSSIKIKEILENISNKQGTSIIDFVNFNFLFQEVKEFCSENNLPIEWLGREKWKIFNRSLLNILKDSPLIGRSDPIEKFSYIEATRKNSDDIDWIIKFPNNPIEFNGSLTELN